MDRTLAPADSAHYGPRLAALSTLRVRPLEALRAG